MSTDYHDDSGYEGLKTWFTRPPYFGAWMIVGFALVIGLAAFALAPRPPAPAPTAMAQAPSPTPVPTVALPRTPLGSVPEPEETPQVSIRTVLGAAPAGVPVSGGPLPAAGVPAVPPSTGPPPVIVPAPLEPGLSSPDPLPTPVEPELDGAPSPPETEPRDAAPPERRQPRLRERVVPVPVPRADTGRVSIYFDADSSTFDRKGRRLPLRVEVFVDGRKLLESSDPEKREFDLGRLPQGAHEIEVVPYVGNLGGERRRAGIQVTPRGRSELEAVIRREEGRSRISKLRERD